MPKEAVKTIKFDSIVKLFDFMSPWVQADLRSGIEFRHFVFRGHSNCRYKLIPTALRDDGPEKIWLAALISTDSKLEIVKDSRLFDTLASHVSMEYRVIRNFYKLADQYGLPLPEHEQLRRNLTSSHDAYGLYTDYPENWIPDNLLEITALAQHYGLPTRLLDWSYDKYIALFFALQGIEDSEGDACIWALDKEYVSGKRYTDDDTGINFVTPSYFGNPNLNAQKGLFTHIPVELPQLTRTATHGVKIPAAPIERKSVDEVIRNLQHDRNTPILLRLDFPKSERVAGLRLLHEMQYSHARLFPGYQGVADEIQFLGRNRLIPNDYNLVFESPKK